MLTLDFYEAKIAPYATGVDRNSILSITVACVLLTWKLIIFI